MMVMTTRGCSKITYADSPQRGRSGPRDRRLLSLCASLSAIDSDPGGDPELARCLVWPGPLARSSRSGLDIC